MIYCGFDPIHGSFRLRVKAKQHPCQEFFWVFTLSSGKKCRRRERKRAIFASKRDLVGEFYIQKPLAFGF
jgi:hypothetical protein